MAIIKVEDIQYNIEKQGNKGPYTCAILTYRRQEKDGSFGYESVKYFFPSHKDYVVLGKVTVGDKLNAFFVKNGKFWEIKDLSIISGNTGEQNTVQEKQHVTKQTNKSVGNDDEYITRMARVTALNQAKDIVLGMLNAGLFKKTIKPELVDFEIECRMKAFEDYLLLKENGFNFNTETQTEDKSSENKDNTNSENDEVPF